MTPTWTIRAASRSDQAFVSEMQYEALFVPPGAPQLDRSVLGQPDIARYHQGFGTRRGDVGRIAVAEDGSPVGAAWVRLVNGYGFVDDHTPELGIAVVPGRRGGGVGTDLLRSLLDEVPRVSLSVDRRNPAFHLYERLGFVEMRRDGDSVVMLRRSGAG